MKQWHPQQTPALILLVMAFILGGVLPRPTQAQAAEPIYTIGIVPQFESRKIRRIWQPIVNYLKKETGYQFRIKGSPTIGEFEQEVFRGEFDFAYMNPLHLVIGNKKVGYRPMLRDIDKELKGVLVVKKESGIRHVSELAGQPVAFPSPHALGASILIRQALEDIFKIKVVPVYAKTHDSVYLNVLLGATVAGGGVQQTLSRQPIERKDALRVLYTTVGVPSHPLAVLPTVPADVAHAVQAAMLHLGEFPQGRALLEHIPMKKIGVTDLKTYQSLTQMGLDRFYQGVL